MLRGGEGAIFVRGEWGDGPFTPGPLHACKAIWPARVATLKSAKMCIISIYLTRESNTFSFRNRAKLGKKTYAGKPMMPRKKASRRAKAAEKEPSREQENVKLRVRCPSIFPGASKGRNELNLDLERTTVFQDRIWVINDFLTAEESDAWVAHGRRTGFETVSHPESWDIAFRENGRIESFDDDVAERIWKRLRPLLPDDLHAGTPVGCYNKIRLYRYGQGQRFGKHIDESNDLSRTTSTGITVLVYLNDEGLQGGETIFYKDHGGRYIATAFKPRRGTLLFHG